MSLPDLLVAMRLFGVEFIPDDPETVFDQENRSMVLYALVFVSVMGSKEVVQLIRSFPG